MQRTDRTRSKRVALTMRISGLAAFIALVASSGGGHAATLYVDEGVVVKAGVDGELVVHDTLVVDGPATLTSWKDDATGGQVTATPQSPLPGDWKGLRLEASSPALETVIERLSIRYAGFNGEPALKVRGSAPSIDGIEITG